MTGPPPLTDPDPEPPIIYVAVHRQDYCDIILGLFGTPEMAAAAAHHPYDGGRVVAVVMNQLITGLPMEGD